MSKVNPWSNGCRAAHASSQPGKIFWRQAFSSEGAWGGLWSGSAGGWAREVTLRGRYDSPVPAAALLLDPESAGLARVAGCRLGSSLKLAHEQKLKSPQSRARDEAGRSRCGAHSANWRARRSAFPSDSKCTLPTTAAPLAPGTVSRVKRRSRPMYVGNAMRVKDGASATRASVRVPYPEPAATHAVSLATYADTHFGGEDERRERNAGVTSWRQTTSGLTVSMRSNRAAWPAMGQADAVNITGAHVVLGTEPLTCSRRKPVKPDVECQHRELHSLGSCCFHSQCTESGAHRMRKRDPSILLSTIS